MDPDPDEIALERAISDFHRAHADAANAHAKLVAAILDARGAPSTERADPSPTASKKNSSSLAVGLLSLGFCLGSVAGASNAQGISTSLLTGLLGLFGGVILSSVGQRNRHVRNVASRPSLDDRRAGIVMAAIAFGTLLGAASGLTFRRHLALIDHKLQRSEELEDQKVRLGPTAPSPPPAAPSTSGLEPLRSVVQHDDGTHIPSTTTEHDMNSKQAVVDSLSGLQADATTTCSTFKRKRAQYQSGRDPLPDLRSLYDAMCSPRALSPCKSIGANIGAGAYSSDTPDGRSRIIRDLDSLLATCPARP
jgi:hypothetical protein